MTVTETVREPVRPGRERTIGSLFSGVGGLDLAVERFFDAETAWHCEFDAEPSKVLAARWPGVPNHGDVTTIDWSTVEPVEILCGGFPCQDLSLAGRRSGMRPGTRSGLWSDFRAAIEALRPKVVVIENVRGLLSGCAESDSDVEPCPGCLGESKQHRPVVRALGRVLGDLAALGFDAEWCPVRASDVGAPHERFRVFVVAYARGVRLDSWRVAGPGETASGRRAPVTLLPTPSAANPNDGEDLDSWLARRERVKSEKVNGNGFGTPLGIAVRLLPTPVTTDARGARNATSGRADGSDHHSGVTLTDALVPKLLPTPQVADATGGHASTSGDRSGELILPGIAREVGALLGTPTTRDWKDGAHVANVPVNGPLGRQVWSLDTDWGEYEPAVRRWESLTRPAPAPTRPDGKNGAHRLSPLLPEWMMGYPAGWVTDILDRNPAIKACGNGVVPQQAFHGLGILWNRVIAAISAGVAA